MCNKNLTLRYDDVRFTMKNLSACETSVDLELQGNIEDVRKKLYILIDSEKSTSICSKHGIALYCLFRFSFLDRTGME